MEKEIEIVEKKNLLEMKCSLELGGIKVWAKSEVFDSFFKSLANGESIPASVSCYGANKAWKLPPTLNTLPVMNGQIANVNIKAWDGGWLIDATSNTQNLSFLRTVGLSEGKEFTFSGVYTKASLDALRTNIKIWVKAFCENYLKKHSFELVITTND